MYLSSTVCLEQSCLKERIHATWNVGFLLILKIHLLKLCFPASGIIPAICDWSFFRIKRDVGSLSCSDVLLLQLRAQDVNSLCCMTAHFTVIHPPSIHHAVLSRSVKNNTAVCLSFPRNVYNPGVQAKEQDLHGM